MSRAFSWCGVRALVLTLGLSQSAAPAAEAGVSLNGASLNGTNLNGVGPQGTSLNGANLNGVGLNGQGAQGTSFNGVGPSSAQASAPNTGALTVRSVRLAPAVEAAPPSPATLSGPMSR